MIRSEDYRFMHQLSRFKSKDSLLMMTEIFLQAVWWDADFNISAEDVQQEYHLFLEPALALFDENVMHSSPMSWEAMESVFYLLSFQMDERVMRWDIPAFDQNLQIRIDGLLTYYRAIKNLNSEDQRNLNILQGEKLYLKAVDVDSSITILKRKKAYYDAIRYFEKAIEFGLQENQEHNTIFNELRPLLLLFQAQVDMARYWLKNNNPLEYKDIVRFAYEMSHRLEKQFSSDVKHPRERQKFERCQTMLREMSEDFLWIQSSENFVNQNR